MYSFSLKSTKMSLMFLLSIRSCRMRTYLDPVTRVTVLHPPVCLGCRPHLTRPPLHLLFSTSIRTTLNQCHGTLITLQLSLLFSTSLIFLYRLIALGNEKEATRNKDQLIFRAKKHLKAKVGEEKECPNPRAKTRNSTRIKR